MTVNWKVLASETHNLKMVEYVKYFVLAKLQASYSTLYHENMRSILPFEYWNSKTLLLHTQYTLIVIITE